MQFTSRYTPTVPDTSGNYLYSKNMYSSISYKLSGGDEMRVHRVAAVHRT